MTILFQSFVILTVFAALSTAYQDDYDGSSTPNLAATSWDNVFLSNKHSSTIPLLRYKNKLYYMAVQFRATWLQAFQFCQALNMKLLTIHSADENERIHKYVRDASKGNEYWTGGSRLIDGTKWVWIPYGTEIEYTNWSTGQPGNINEKCLQLWRVPANELTWNDRDCNAQFFFICERYLNSDNVGPPGL